MKICINAYTMKTQLFNKIIYDLKSYFYVMEKFCDFFTFHPFDLITTLTYILMVNLCPCFSVKLPDEKGQLNRLKKFQTEVPEKLENAWMRCKKVIYCVDTNSNISFLYRLYI